MSGLLGKTRKACTLGCRGEGWCGPVPGIDPIAGLWDSDGRRKQAGAPRWITYPTPLFEGSPTVPACSGFGGAILFP